MAYDINRRKRFATVGELEELLANIPSETEILICGDEECWFHVEEDESTVCLDFEDLESTYEYDALINDIEELNEEEYGDDI